MAPPPPAKPSRRRGARARPSSCIENQGQTTFNFPRCSSAAAKAWPAPVRSRGAREETWSVPVFRMNAYTAPWWLPGGHLQTIVASLLPPPRVALERQRWDTPDGDFIDVDFAGEPGASRMLVLFHGLEGCSDSHYARAVAAHAASEGWRVAIPHWRGCSGEPNRKPRAYHSGDTAEVDWLLRRFQGPVDAIGISLGGNALLK